MNRYAALDGFRGVAAICVVLLHAGAMSPIPMTGGFLAVDLFFLLSGFVLAKAYGPALFGGISPREFMVIRLRRLAPMYLLGAVLGLCVMAIKGFDPGQLAILVALPTPGAPPDYIMPANPPAWSLLLELVVNAGFAMAFVWLTRWRWFVIAIAALVTAWGAYQFGLDALGPTWRGIWFGLARATAWFVLGMAMVTVPRSGKVSVWATALVFALPLLFAFAPVPLAVLLIPLAVLFAIRFEPRLPALCQWLGGLSYPLYCIHYPLLVVSTGAIRRFDLPPKLSMVMVVVALVLLAAALERYADLPIRATLAGRKEPIAK